MNLRLGEQIKAAFAQISAPGILIANAGSMSALALSGVALNLLIGRLFGFEGLGVFSQALLFFLILGQIAAGGFAFAALYHFSRHGAQDSAARTYLLAVSLPVCLIGIFIAAALWFGGPFLGWLLGSQALGEALPAVGFGVFLFGLNKIGINALNGMEHLKTYALLQGLRMPLMLAAFLVLVASGGTSADLGWIFVASELVIFVPMLTALALYTRGAPLQICGIGPLLRREGWRGWRGALIGLLADVNSKVDVLLLGLLTSDHLLGIYALGAMFADGLRMLLAAIQSIINPRLAQYIEAQDRPAFEALYASLARVGHGSCASALLLGTAFMLVLAPGLLGAVDVMASTTVFLVMGAATTLAAPAIILNQIFAQAGRPGLQTAFLALLASVNLCLNLALIPPLGPLGAAIATGIAELAQLALLLRWRARLFG